MQYFKTILLSISFWQLIFSPMAYASNEIASLGFSEVIKELNTKNYTNKELLNIIKDKDKKTHADLEDYLKKNGITDLGKTPNVKFEYLKDKTYKLTIENKDYTVTMLNTDLIKIALKDKAVNLSLKNGNTIEWMQALNSLHSNVVTFNFSNLFISEANAGAILLISVVLLLIAALASAYMLNTKPLENAVSNADKACRKATEDPNQAFAENPQLNNSYENLSRIYKDKCKAKPSANVCINANRVLECLRGIINPQAQQADAGRGSKPIDDSGSASSSSVEQSAVAK